MKTLILAAIRCSLMFLVTGSLFSVQPAQAFTVTLQEMGLNVVANGRGAINLTGLSIPTNGSSVAAMQANIGDLAVAGGSQDVYRGLTGPSSFGIGGLFFASSSSGDAVTIFGNFMGDIRLFVPQGYVSGTALSDSATYNNASFFSLGVTPGTYVWTWGTGLRNQNFTLIIGRAGVPDGGSTVSLLGFALLGLAAVRRTLRC